MQLLYHVALEVHRCSGQDAEFLSPVISPGTLMLLSCMLWVYNLCCREAKFLGRMLEISDKLGIAYVSLLPLESALPPFYKH